ncbi:uncharacterized protein CcaverHIS019_0301520 [Cutaneotrichosporon cavernicola]|uniref:Uncharacterized protein n=1 Tax=Cutaneotrichosporon cavernicola TaxID=279322 RepID=A0AA48L254_9TREE|nr:uncharacterized protein CcaverHIS019_0301520 [Cutaneotrichosporon cavernicola]BEI90082.1 hypothetical protein CcaverHIS019_0301520 [Cutaneotrichosporon cavernicola]
MSSNDEMDVDPRMDIEDDIDIEDDMDQDFDVLLAELHERELDDEAGPCDVPEDEVHRQSKLTWRRFKEFFEEQRNCGLLNLMPGCPKAHTDYLDKNFAQLDYGTCAAFMLWMAGSTASSIENPGPSIVTLTGYWFYFKQHYFAKRGGQLIPKDICLLDSFLEEGILSDIRRVRTIATPAGIRSIAFSAWQPEWSPNVLQRRWQFIFWQAVMLQGNTRVRSIVGDNKEQVAAYGHFKLLFGRVNDDDSAPEYQVGLLMQPINSKTATAKGTFHLLNSTAERWRCPVTSFLVLASLDDALPENLDLGMFDNIGQILNGEEIKILSCRKPDMPVFRGENAKRGMYNNAWNSKGLGVLLKNLCELAEFEAHLQPSSYRTIGLQYMAISGVELEKLQIKADHVFNSTVTDIYLRQLPPVDIKALVWGQKDRLMEAYELHPHATRPGLGPARASTVTGVVPSSLVNPETEVEYLDIMQNILFGASKLDGATLKQCAVPLPQLNSLSSFMPAGGVGKNDTCATCGRVLEGCPSDILEHVLPCARAEVKKEVRAGLLGKYPVFPSLDMHPSLTFTDSVTDKKSKPHPTSIGRGSLNPRLVWNDNQGEWTFDLSSLKLALYTQLSKYGKFTCKCGHRSLCISMAVQHQLSHGLWVADLPKALSNKKFRLPCEPRYFWELGRWVSDPRELEIVCERLFNERFVNLPQDYRYRVRYDMCLGDVEAAALEPDLQPGYTDYSYDGRICRSTILHDRVCFCCVHSTAEAFHVRMAFPAAKHHQALHLCREFLRAKDEEEGIFVRRGQLICPDLVCSRHHRTFDNLLYLVWHLAAVHRLQLHKTLANRTTPMSELTVADASELIIFLAACAPNALSTTLEKAAATPLDELDWTYALENVDFIRSLENADFRSTLANVDFAGVFNDVDFSFS